MRLAAIDIGTNSIHMIIVRVRPDLSFEVIDREKDMVRLGAGGLDGRRLGEAAMVAGLQTLSKFRRLADAHAVEEIVAVATSAIREAGNGGEFLDLVARETGIEARIISGVEEARLIHQAAAYGTNLASRRGVVVDIGGGSVEITLGTATRILLARSFKIGAIRMTERYVATDPLARRDERRLVRAIEEELGAYLGQVRRRGFDVVVGTSGTIVSLGSLAASQQTGAPVPDVRNLRVPARNLRKLRKALVASTLDQRLAWPGLDPRRADLAVAGAVILDTILQLLGAEDLVLCDLALREGLVLDYIKRNQAHIAQVERYPDARRRSVIELAERCRYQAAHAAQVTRLALSIFDQTQGRHGLGPREREWLEYAAVLHDVGRHISYEGHHRHSHYLIKHGGLRGFEPEEIDVIALVARYHRTGAPRKAHPEFASLRGPLRRTVRTLSAMLAVAEGLDRSHADAVAAVEAHETPEGLRLRVHPLADAELEVWAANRHVARLEKVLATPVQLETVRPAMAALVGGTSPPATRGPAIDRPDDVHGPAADGLVASATRAPRGAGNTSDTLLKRRGNVAAVS